MVTGWSLLLSATAVAAALAAPMQAVQARDKGDIREFAVGMHVADLPATGYVRFTCGHDQDAIRLAGWAEYVRCPADEAGLHEVAFRFDDSEVVFEEYEGTKIGGHPVLLSLLLTGDGVVEGIRVLTDPAASFRHRRQVFTMRINIMGRFGPTDWQCRDLDLAEGEGPVGGMLIKQVCEREDEHRRFYLETRLHSVPYLPPDNVLRSTRFEIWRTDTRTG